MITNRWIEKRRAFWDRLGALIARAVNDGIRSLSREELREMALLYRQAAGDLAFVRQDTTARSIEGHLNQLMVRAHTIIYSSRKPGFGLVFHFLRDDYPRLFRKLLPFSILSLTIFLGGGLLGVLLTLSRPDFPNSLLGPAMIQTIQHHTMWTHSVSSMAPQASTGILTNNLGVTFATFASGVTAGLGTLYLIAFNGLLLGVIGTACHMAQMSVQLWSFVAPHGSLELPSILIAGAAGFRLAYGLLFPGMYSRRHSFTVAGAEAIRLLAGVVPLLVIAGILEGFFSPSNVIAGFKFLVGGVLFTLLILWLSGSAGNRVSTGNRDQGTDNR